MMNWLRKCFRNKTDYPEFWQHYTASFANKNQERVVVLDCETTGLQPKEDKILSIGAVALHQHVIHVEDSFSVFLKQELHKPQSIPIHGIVKNKNLDALDEKEAIKQLLAYLKNAKIVGHHIQFDIEMLNRALAGLNLPKLKNKIQDTGDLYLKYKGIQEHMHKSLDELCDEFSIPKKSRHTALGDAFLTAQVYQRLVIR